MRSLALALLLALPTTAAAQTYASGLTLAFPDDWSGTEQVDESALPQAASYRFENTNPESPWHGAIVHVERMTGLNPMMRQRWMQGRVPFGYHGAEPVAALARPQIPFPGAVGIRTERDGRPGAVYFTSVGQTYWAVQIEVPQRFGETPNVAPLAEAVRLSSGS